MPATAGLALAGSAAIAALPPFNGFVSEWLTLQAVLNAPALPQWPLKFAVPVAGAALALAAALAAACFVRAYGAAFLGRPRAPEAEAAHEVDAPMRGAMAALAGLCLAAGIFPLALIALANPVLRMLAGAPFMALADGLDAGDLLWLTPLEPGRSSYSGPIVLLVVALTVWAVVEGVHRLATARLRRGPAWDCGFPDPSPATQYSASSFAQPLRRVFGTLVFRARETVDMPEPGETRAATFAVALVDPSWRAFYAPVGRLVATLADRFNALQFLTIRRYLALMFAALILLLIANVAVH
jgi:NADH:ubiquinone oxidoreductase subunit 5 (subunit L)/multisubunit Na+/H+ antiporter MnhA subunit